MSSLTHYVSPNARRMNVEFRVVTLQLILTGKNDWMKLMK